MSSNARLTLYTYSPANEAIGDRWRDEEIRSEFFNDEKSARLAVEGLLSELAQDEAMTLTPMQIEKIETVPLTRESILNLLNEGIGSFVCKCEILDTVFPQ